MAITVQKSRKDEKLDVLENRIYQASYTALSHLDIDLKNLSEGITPPKKIRPMSLEDAVKLKRFYEECNIAADEGKRGKLKKLCLLELDTILVEDFMDRNLVKALVAYQNVVWGMANKKSRKSKTSLIFKYLGY